MTNTSTDINERIPLAANWYDHGEPVWDLEDGTVVSIVDRINFDILGDLWRSIEDERTDHHEAARRYATMKTGYDFDLTSLSTDFAAYSVIENCEYQRLEAAARERRILALAVTIR